MFENELGVADFYLPKKMRILYVSESDIIAGNGYKRKLVRYRNVSLDRKLPDSHVLWEHSHCSVLHLSFSGQ